MMFLKKKFKVGGIEMKRLNKDDYYMNIARAVSLRSTCIRAHAGAIIVKDDQIVSTGYSGSARGEKNCCDVDRCERDILNIKPGTRYELCKSVHAEANAIIHAGCDKTNGGTMYLYFERLDGRKEKHGGPCIMCARMIKQAGIKEIKVEEIV